MPTSCQHDLIAWQASGDESAASRLIEALHPQIYRIVSNHLPRGTAAEDLVQDVFVQFFKNLHRYEPARPLENWVSRLCLNVCLNALRAKARRPEYRWSDLPEDAQHAAESLLQQPPEDPAPNESRELLRALLESLAPKDQIIITLLHLEERSIPEIADLTGWNATVIKVRAFRARRRLRAALDKLLKSPPPNKAAPAPNP
jgi:RNA polymerase sigma-70 factor (ECF subfamily)